MKNKKTEAEMLCEYANKECDALAKMQKPLSLPEANELIAKFGYDATTRQLAKMNNWRGIEKKNRSVFLTCAKWFEMDEKKGYGKAKVEPYRKPTASPELAEFKKRFPIGTEIESPTGRRYIVGETFLEPLDGDGVMPISYAIGRQFTVSQHNKEISA